MLHCYAHLRFCDPRNYCCKFHGHVPAALNHALCYGWVLGWGKAGWKKNCGNWPYAPRSPRHTIPPRRCAHGIPGTVRFDASSHALPKHTATCGSCRSIRTFHPKIYHNNRKSSTRNASQAVNPNTLLGDLVRRMAPNKHLFRI